MPEPLVKHIVSRDNPLLIQLRKQLKDPAGYRKTGQVWLEGEHLCQAAVQHEMHAEYALISETAWEQPALRALAATADTVVVLGPSLMAGLSSLESPAPLGFVLKMPVTDELQPDASTVILDRLQDPGNVGTILRSAAAFGFQQIVALKGTVALWSPKVLRAGMGAHFGLQLVESLEPAALKRLKVPVLLSSPHASDSIHRSELPWPCAWLVGHEGQGVSDDAAHYAQRRLRIPQPGGQESLNAAVATAICLYESVRSRG